MFITFPQIFQEKLLEKRLTEERVKSWQNRVIKSCKFLLLFTNKYMQSHQPKNLRNKLSPRQKQT